MQENEPGVAMLQEYMQGTEQKNKPVVQKEVTLLHDTSR